MKKKLTFKIIMECIHKYFKNEEFTSFMLNMKIREYCNVTHLWDLEFQYNEFSLNPYLSKLIDEGILVIAGKIYAKKGYRLLYKLRDI